MPNIQHGISNAQGKTTAGVTLLELLVAVTILTVVMGSLYVTMRTAMRAYRDGVRSAATLQTVRSLTDQLTREARCVFYKSYMTYNIEFRKKMLERQLLEEQRRVNGLPDGAMNNPNWVDPLGYNPAQFTHQIDLGFKGEKQEFMFVRYQPTQGDIATQPWALACVTYKYDPAKKTVVRREKPVFVRPKEPSAGQLDQAAEATPETEKETEETVADNVSAFSLFYGYYYDGQWLEADRWISSEHQFRNPPVECEKDDPMADRIRQYNESAPFDELPSYLDMDLTVMEPDNPKRTVSARHLVLFPTATETYMPVPPDIETSNHSRSGRTQ